MSRKPRLASLVLTLSFAMPAALRAQNLVPNPDFNLDAAGWSALYGSVDWVEDDPDCSGQVPGSGALVLESEFFEGGELAYAASPCFVVTPGPLCFSMEYFQGGDAVWLEATYFPDDECPGSGFVDASPAMGIGSYDGYTQIGSCTTVPVGTHRMKLQPKSLLFTFPGTSFLFVDRLYAGTATRVFADDFEPGAACRWAVTP